MGSAIFFDTCALYGETLCDVILRLAERRLFTPYWSPDVLAELERVLAPRVGAGRARRRVEAMRIHFPEAMVHGYEGIASDMECAGEDKHVLAAASVSPARTLVTFNLKDFPESTLSKLGMTAESPDEFLSDVVAGDPSASGRVCYELLRSYRHYPQNPEDFAAVLQKAGCPKTAAAVYPPLVSLYENGR